MEDQILARMWKYTLITIFCCVLMIIFGISYWNYTFRIGGYCEQQRFGTASLIWVKCDSIQKPELVK